MSQLRPIYAADAIDAIGMQRGRMDSLRASQMLESNLRDGRSVRRIFGPKDILRLAIVDALTNSGCTLKVANRTSHSLDTISQLAEVGSLWADKIFAGKPTPEVFLLWLTGPDGSVIDVEHRTGIDRAAAVVSDWILKRPAIGFEQIGRANVSAIGRKVAAKLRERGCL